MEYASIYHIRNNAPELNLPHLSLKLNTEWIKQPEFTIISIDNGPIFIRYKNNLIRAIYQKTGPYTLPYEIDLFKLNLPINYFKQVQEYVHLDKLFYINNEIYKNKFKWQYCEKTSVYRNLSSYIQMAGRQKIKNNIQLLNVKTEFCYGYDITERDNANALPKLLNFLIPEISKEILSYIERKVTIYLDDYDDGQYFSQKNDQTALKKYLNVLNNHIGFLQLFYVRLYPNFDQWSNNILVLNSYKIMPKNYDSRFAQTHNYYIEAAM
jgi:hypothetical protein